MNADTAVDLRRTYERDGFCRVERLLPDDVVRRGVKGMDDVRAGRYDTGVPPVDSPWKPGDDPRILCKIEMPHVASTALREVVTHRALGEFAAAITGARCVQVWWVQLLYKPPGGAASSTAIGWHQDKQYWKCWTPDSELFTVWVALSDVTSESGPVRFVPGSHRWGLLDQGDFFEQNEDRLRQNICVPAGQTWNEVAVTMPAGGASAHDSLTYHGSTPNVSKHPRRSLAIHMRTEKSRPIEDLSRLRPEEGPGLVQFLDDEFYNPVIYGTRS